MNKPRKLISFNDARRGAGEILPERRLLNFISSGLVFSPRRRDDDGQRLVDWNDVAKMVKKIRQAIKYKRSTTKAHKEKGFKWVPLAMVEEEYGFSRSLAAHWARGTYGCAWLGSEN